MGSPMERGSSRDRRSEAIVGAVWARQITNLIPRPRLNTPLDPSSVSLTIGRIGALLP